MAISCLLYKAANFSNYKSVEELEFVSEGIKSLISTGYLIEFP